MAGKEEELKHLQEEFLEVTWQRNGLQSEKESNSAENLQLKEDLERSHTEIQEKFNDIRSELHTEVAEKMRLQAKVNKL